MGGRRRLTADQPRVLGRHDTDAGRAFRRAWLALSEEFGPFRPHTLARLAATRCASAWATYEAATRRLAEAREARGEGKGRRPSSSEISRLEKRQGLADSTYAAALAQLRELAGPRADRIPTPAEIQAALRSDRG